MPLELIDLEISLALALGMRLCADEADLKAKLPKSWLSAAQDQSVQKSGDEYFGRKSGSFFITFLASSCAPTDYRCLGKLHDISSR